MDVKEMVQNNWFTAQDIKNSPTKIATIVDPGTVEEATSQKGEKYQALKLKIDIDKVVKEWRPNKYALRKLSERFGTTKTEEWVGKQVALTTMLMQGGKEGIIPV